MATINNTTFLDFELCDSQVTVPSNQTETEIIDLQISKEASCDYTVVGGTICYTITIVNNSDVNLTFQDDGASGITFRDPLATNLSYRPGTFSIQVGSSEPIYLEPDINADNVLTFSELEIPANTTMTITFCVRVEYLPTTTPA